MSYQVWIKEEYAENYTKVDCEDLAAAKRAIDEAVRKGQQPILTQEVPYKLEIKIQEVDVETFKSKAKSSAGAGAEGKGEVRQRDTSPVPKLSEGSGDNKSSDIVPGK